MASGAAQLTVTDLPAWRQVQLADVAEFSNGANFTKEAFGRGIKIIGVRDFQDRLSPVWSEVDEVQKTAISSARYFLAEGDLLFVRSNGNRDLVGRCMLVTEGPEATHSAFTIRARPDTSQVVPRFLAYQMRYAHRVGRMLTATGTNITNLNQSILGNVPVLLPNLDLQKRIVSVFAAYDELIENNLRRIEILEEMAKAIYREWFVDFRFPGHEDVDLMDSVSGPTPNDWRIESLSEVTEVIKRGVAPKYDEESPALAINQRCIRNGRISLELARRHRSSVPPDKLVTLGDVLINSTGVGTLGRVAQIGEVLNNVTVDTHVTILRPQASRVDPHYFGIALLAKEPEFAAMGVGSTGQTELGRARIAETSIVIPPKELQVDFGSTVTPLRALALRLDGQNRNLQASRDLLLPKLISGEIDVSELDIDTSWLAA